MQSRFVYRMKRLFLFYFVNVIDLLFSGSVKG